MAKQEAPLSWKKQDPERRFGFAGGKYTGPGMLPPLLLGTWLSAAFYAVLYFVRCGHPDWEGIAMFFPGGSADRSGIPALTVWLAAWSLGILWCKWRKLRFQRRAFRFRKLFSDRAARITPGTARELLDRLADACEDPARFVLLNRIMGSLTALRDGADETTLLARMAAQAAEDEKYFESTYTLLRGLVWAIPVLGFIGTVLGLARSVGGFGAVIAQGADLAELQNALSKVTGGLAVAFETTLIALVAAIVIHLLMTLLVKREEELLDQTAEFCRRNFAEPSVKAAGASDVRA